MPKLLFHEAFSRLCAIKFKQKDLADYLNTTPSHVSKILSGKTNPDTENLYLICQFAEIKVEELLQLMYGGKRY